MKKEISEFDIEQLKKIRDNVSKFVSLKSSQLDKKGLRVLDIAPQDHEGASPYFIMSNVETLDIDTKSGATYIADLCKNNEHLIPDNYFDVVVCTEVLEHTRQPFKATEEILRILKPGGVILASSPYNFRIHGPLPDCWRFTEHGLRELFKNFTDIDIVTLEDENRFLMPVHYTLTAKKENFKQ